jgi:hypothetical protein
MHDEFRVTVAVDDPRAFIDALETLERGDPVLGELDRVAVTHDANNVFVYADSLEAAQHAATAARGAMAQKHLAGEVGTWRWHPLEERWEDASTPLPQSESERVAEHQRLQQHEREESLQAGYPEWEVRVTLPSHHDAQALAERLRGEGLQVTQRWRHVLAGANDEDDAQALAERIRGEVPAGGEIVCEGTGAPYWNMLGAPARPFAFFGGLAR